MNVFKKMKTVFVETQLAVSSAAGLQTRLVVKAGSETQQAVSLRGREDWGLGWL